MRVFHVARRVGATIEGSGSPVVCFWARGPGYFRHVAVHSPVNLSLHFWRYAVRALGIRRAILACGFVRG